MQYALLMRTVSEEDIADFAMIEDECNKLILDLSKTIYKLRPFHPKLGLDYLLDNLRETIGSASATCEILEDIQRRVETISV